MSDLTDLRVGDRCWMLNGVRNRSFLCKVVSTTENYPEIVTVENLDKSGILYSFRKEDGAPASSYQPFDPAATRPTLVPYDDRYAQDLDIERVHRGYRDDIARLLIQMPADPGVFDQVDEILKEWRAVATREDQEQ